MTAHKWTLDTLRAIRTMLAEDALMYGQYGLPWTEARYDTRGRPPYRSTAYEQTIRRITALDRAIRDLEARETEPR